MKKLFKKAIVASVVTFLIGGAFVSLNKKDKDHFLTAKAENITETTTLYFRPGGAWRAEDVKAYSAYFFLEDDSMKEFKALEAIPNTDHLYKVEGVEGKEYEGIIFVAHNSEGEPSWDTKKYQTQNLTFDAPNNLFLVPDGETDWVDPNNWHPYVEGEWSVVTKTQTQEGITTTKMRVWLNRSGHYMDGYEYLLHVGETYFAPTGYVNALVASNAHFAYYDVEINDFIGKEVSFAITNNESVVVKAIPAVYFNSRDNSSLLTINYDEDANTWSYEKGYVEERVYNGFVAKVLEGYLSCSPSFDNGYEAFNLINQSFIPRAYDEQGDEFMDIEGDLDQVTIMDFVNTEDYNDVTKRTSEVNAWAKYQELERNYNVAHGLTLVTTNNSNTSSNLVLIFTILVATLGISLILLVRYRKKISA
ncbi:MAG: hypothetical protein ACOX28_01745 [Bacilli bacterium]|jgi:hypothetical protein